jgi:hypothetical protein
VVTTRKQLLLEYLKARPNQWVPGMELFIQYVGGSRGTSRIHELRREGHNIEKRRSFGSAVWEYRLVIEDVAPGQISWVA